jgi:hypothetical protein
LISLFLINNVFRKTAEQFIQNKELKSELKKANEAPAQLKSLQVRLQQADAIFHEQKNAEGINIHDRILGIVSKYCQESGVTLMSYPEPNISKDGNFVTETNILTVQGGFRKILELIYLLEQKEKPAKISSVNYKTQKNFDNQHIELIATIYLQTFKKNEP